ncbi:disulfide bond formation protein B [Rhodoblastus sp.]|uniref:disulfide bond formation protein B n=1 Tax=Rhodoblastus sp. TaxID=1962975 RepID=UPI002604125B|nr:disulfide bond formation protein B [Rhodoblastus sp.]
MGLFARLRAALSPEKAALLVLAAAAATLAGAWTFQALGFLPCELCLIERYPYYGSLPLAAVAFFLARNAPPLFARAVLGLLAAIFAAGAALAAYHAGVEWKFWPGPAGCTGKFVAPTSMEAFRAQLEHVHVVRCDAPALRILGLSLAGWNVPISLAIGFAALLGATAPKKA